MKKTLVALMLVALAVPAMADVAITGVDEGSQNLAIYADSAAVMRGVALKLTITGGNLASTADYLASDFNTFVDFAFTTGAGYTVGAGHPIADAAAAGVATFPATTASISVGYLDQLGAQAGLTGKKLVARLHISGIAAGTSASIAIEADTLRGGAVVGDTVGAVTIQTPVLVAGPQDECVKSTASFYADWVSFGKPDCWCYRKNCKGDADGLFQSNKQGKWAVGTNDLNILLPAFQIFEAPAGPGVLTKLNGICADFDHAAQSNKQGKWRVGTNDLNILLANWQKFDPAIADCDMTNYNFWKN